MHCSTLELGSCYYSPSLCSLMIMQESWGEWLGRKQVGHVMKLARQVRQELEMVQSEMWVCRGPVSTHACSAGGQSK